MTTSARTFSQVQGMGEHPQAPPTNQPRPRIVKNKLILGLGIVLFLVWTAGNFLPNDQAPKLRTESSSSRERVAASSAISDQSAAPVIVLQPELAKQFVGWWLTKAMDYQSATAGRSHGEALGWMTPQASQAFQQTFWTPEIASGITQGRIAAAFQPIAVQAEAINPDGSVVVGVSGTLVAQEATNPTPATTQIVCDFLVKREKDGLRIAGLYNRTAAP